MDAEQMVLIDVMEEVLEQKILWKQLDIEIKMIVINQLSDLIAKAVQTDEKC